MNVEERIRAAIDHLRAAWGDSSSGLVCSASCEMARARQIVIALDDHLSAVAAVAKGFTPGPVPPAKLGQDMVASDPAILLPGQTVPEGGVCVVCARLRPLPVPTREPAFSNS